MRASPGGLLPEEEVGQVDRERREDEAAGCLVITGIRQDLKSAADANGRVL